MKYRFGQNKRGFTLPELLIVVAIVAVLSTMAITMYGNLQDDSAETINVANIKRISSSLTTYSTVNGGSLPNKVDSLVRSDADALPGVGAYSGDGSEATNILVDHSAFYIGMDTDDDGLVDDDTEARGLGDANEENSAVDPNWAFHSLIPARLTQQDVEDLKKVGITSVYDFNPDSDLWYGESPRSDERELVAGGLVAMIDPMNIQVGQGLYSRLGFPVEDLIGEKGAGPRGALTEEQRERALDATDGRRFFVFGLGSKCTLIGAPNCGLQEAPQCKIVKDERYNNYFMVVSMRRNSPTDQSKPRFRMILDSTGKDAVSALSWSTRTE